MKFASALVLCGLLAVPPAYGAAEKVVLSFAFVGCNRLDSSGIKANKSVSTANEAQLLRTFADVSAHARRPDLMILAGDVVNAKTAGTEDLSVQLPAWRTLVDGKLPESTRLVAFTGNHELLMDSSHGSKVEIPNPPAYKYWQAQMKDFIAGSDGPAKGGADELLDDEAGLSYTFKTGNTLFVVVNTDTLVDLNQAGRVPLKWLGQKLTAAQNDSSVQHIFVMGHKPIARTDKKKKKRQDAGKDTIDASQGSGFYDLLNQHGKVRAYLAAHAHRWSFARGLKDLEPQSSEKTGKARVPQIIAGNGGSPPEDSWVASGNYFGYTLIEVTEGGTVTAQSFGRTIPGVYSAQKPALRAATKRSDRIVLHPVKPKPKS